MNRRSGDNKDGSFKPLILSILIGWGLFFILYTNDADATELDDIYYMSEAIYFEARDQALVGQVAVGCVIRNRLESSRWPNSVKEVVHQYKQFSYYWDGKPESKTDFRADYHAYQMAQRVLHTEICAVYEGIDHYINHQIADKKAVWYKSMTKVLVVGDHTFYRSKL